MDKRGEFGLYGDPRDLGFVMSGGGFLGAHIYAPTTPHMAVSGMAPNQQNSGVNVSIVDNNVPSVFEDNATESSDSDMESDADSDEYSEEELELIELLEWDAKCGCDLGKDGKPCVNMFPRDFLLKHREVCMNLASRQRDLVIMGQLQSHQRIWDCSGIYKALHDTEMDKIRKSLEGRFLAPGRRKPKKPRPPITRYIYEATCKFFLADIPICPKAFCFIHGIGERHLEDIQAHLDEEGLSPMPQQQQQQQGAQQEPPQTIANHNSTT